MTEKAGVNLGVLTYYCMGETGYSEWKIKCSLPSTQVTSKNEMDCHLSLEINSALFSHFT